MNRLLLAAVKAIISIAVLYGLLSFLAGFSDKQSVLLALLFYGVYSSLSTLSSVKQTKFVPFSVFVAPSLVNILQDFDLVKARDEDWAEIHKGIEKLSEKDWNIWHPQGFVFYFLTEKLIYDQDHRTFSAEELDLHASLAPAVIVRDHEAPDSMFRNYSPHLSLRAGLDFGCILQLILPDWYWDKIKTSEILKTIPASDVSEDHMCGTIDVILARIPPEEFAVHQAMGGGYSKDADQQAVQNRKQARTHFGWKGKTSSGDMYGNKTDGDHNDQAEHRYCEVTHGAI
jgi:hypothetical protein